jgi:hypothetical protein
MAREETMREKFIRKLLDDPQFEQAKQPGGLT